MIQHVNMLNLCMRHAIFGYTLLSSAVKMVKSLRLRNVELLLAFYALLPSTHAHVSCSYNSALDVFNCTTTNRDKSIRVKIFDKEYDFNDITKNGETPNLLRIPLGSKSEPTASRVIDLKRKWEVVVHPRPNYRQILTTPYPFQHDVSVLNEFYNSKWVAATYLNRKVQSENPLFFKKPFPKLFLPTLKRSIKGSLLTHYQIDQQIWRAEGPMEFALNEDNDRKESLQLLNAATQYAKGLSLKKNRFTAISPFHIPQFTSSKPGFLSRVKKYFSNKNPFILSEVVKSPKGNIRYTSFYRSTSSAQQDPRYIVEYQTSIVYDERTVLCIELDEHLHYCGDEEASNEKPLQLKPNKNVEIKLSTMEERLELEMENVSYSEELMKGIQDNSSLLHNDHKRNILNIMKNMTSDRQKEKEFLLDLILFEKSEFVMSLRFLYLQIGFFNCFNEKTNPVEIYFKEVKVAYLDAIYEVYKALKGKQASSLTMNTNQRSIQQIAGRLVEEKPLLEVFTSVMSKKIEIMKSELKTLLKSLEETVSELLHTSDSSDSYRTAGSPENESINLIARLSNQLQRAFTYEMKAFSKKWTPERSF